MRADMDEESYPGHFVCEMPMEVRNTPEEGQLWIWIYRLESHPHLRENTSHHYPSCGSEERWADTKS